MTSLENPRAAPRGLTDQRGARYHPHRGAATRRRAARARPRPAPTDSQNNRATAPRAMRERKCCDECSRRRRKVTECKPQGPGRKCWTCEKWGRECSFIHTYPPRESES